MGEGVEKRFLKVDFFRDSIGRDSFFFFFRKWRFVNNLLFDHISESIIFK